MLYSLFSFKHAEAPDESRFNDWEAPEGIILYWMTGEAHVEIKDGAYIWYFYRADYKYKVADSPFRYPLQFKDRNHHIAPKGATVVLTQEGLDG